MFWADKIAEETKKRFVDKIARGEKIVIRDEKTASGRVHVGSLRGVAIHGIVSEVLNAESTNTSQFIYEINDFDPMDGLPTYLDEARFSPQMGRQLMSVESPELVAPNFAEYFGRQFETVINKIGFYPTFTRASNLYISGKMDSAIRDALLGADKIREIFKKISGNDKPAGWLPLNVVCESCGKLTTESRDFDGDTVEYTCGNFYKWANGCGHTGRISPFGGKAKLPWKVEWAAKFKVYGVDVEGGGKDHSTKGGARQVADAISREIFKYEPPLNIPYEFLLVGGKKMSSSKGAGSSAEEIVELLPPALVRFLMFFKDPMKTIDFIPDGDTVPILYDTFDKYLTAYFEGVHDDYTRTVDLCLSKDSPLRSRHLLPRFSQVAYLVQMPHIDNEVEISKLYNKELSELDKTELAERGEYANKWLSLYAPEDYKFEIQQSLPDGVFDFSDSQKGALVTLAEYIEKNEHITGEEMHTKLHELRSESGLEARDFFSALYISILGKTHGPKAGWFLSVLDRDFIIKRFREVSKSR